MNSQSGRLSSARAIASRCCSPPDSSCAQFSSRARSPARCARPTAVSASRAASSLIARRVLRISDRVLERADRQVGPLRQEQQLRALRQRDLPLPVRPDARDGAEQRRLARARGTGDEHGLALASAPGSRPRAAACPAADRAPAAQASRSAGAFDPLAAHRCACLRARALERLSETGQAIHRRLPVGEAGVGVDEPGQRALHLAERARRSGRCRPAACCRRKSAATRPRTEK